MLNDKPLAANSTLLPTDQPKPSEEFPVAAEHLEKDIGTITEQYKLTRMLLDQIDDYLYIKDRDSRFVVTNRSHVIDLGFTEPSDLIGKTDFALHDQSRAKEFRRLEVEIMQSRVPLINREESVLNSRGEIRWLSTSKYPIIDKNNDVIGILGIARNITELKKAESIRNRHVEILNMIAKYSPIDDILNAIIQLAESQINGISAAVYFTSTDGKRIERNIGPSRWPGLGQRIVGMPVNLESGSTLAAMSRRAPVFVDDVSKSVLWQPFLADKSAGDIASCWSFPILSSENTSIGGMSFYSREKRLPTAVEAEIVNVSVGLAGIALDRKLTEDRIRYMASHDPLTGLSNRAEFAEQLNAAIDLAKWNGQGLVLAFVDLDNFKYINDSLGHQAGDELLRTAADRMRRRVRQSDSIYRLGGDEFVIILREAQHNSSGILEALDRLGRFIAEPVTIFDHTITVTASIGAAVFPQDGTTAEGLIAKADQAMYTAKAEGRNRVQFYEDRIDATAENSAKLSLLQGLQFAIKRNEFVLHYQPQASAKSGIPFAVEALVRWNHPTRGLVPPDDFIPIAESNGMIGQIGEWVLHQACQQAVDWHRRGMPPIAVCVNVSGRQLHQRNFCDSVKTALRDSGLDPFRLELELTESILMQDTQVATETMQELGRLGVSFAIDDFGTGYSNLASLREFPVRRLKIDKTFVRHIGTEASDRIICETIIMLAHKLSMRVIAEGVETPAQRAILVEAGCDEVQGYLLGRPMTATALFDWWNAYNIRQRQRVEILAATG